MESAAKRSAGDDSLREQGEGNSADGAVDAHGEGGGRGVDVTTRVDEWPQQEDHDSNSAVGEEFPVSAVVVVAVGSPFLAQ